jgi:hypothetical protein
VTSMCLPFESFPPDRSILALWRDRIPFKRGLMVLACSWLAIAPCLAQEPLYSERASLPAKPKQVLDVLHPGPVQGTNISMRSESHRILGPLVLVSPLSTDAIERLYGEADGHYQGRAQRQALDALLQLLELAPEHVPGWLRLGNVLQQRQEVTLAGRAYRRCVELSRIQGASAAEFGHKALFNLASISLQRAQEAVLELEGWRATREHRTAQSELGEGQEKPRIDKAGDHAPASTLRPMVELLSNRWQELQSAAGPAQASSPPVQLVANAGEPVASPKVPVYQGWAKRRQPGHRQLALPPEDEPRKGQAPSKPVVRAGEGLQAAQPRIQELRTTPENTGGQGLPRGLPEVIYLNGKPGVATKALQ